MAVVISGVSFVAGRYVERQAHESGEQKVSGPVVNPQVRAETIEEHDAKRCSEILRLYDQVSNMNWELLTPFTEYQAGKIDAATLGRRSAEPENENLRRCTRMYELAAEIKTPDTREKFVALTAAILERHRGFSMMIEGITRDEPSRIAAGEKLFVEGRDRAIAAAARCVDAKSPEAAQLNRLLDAYKAGEGRP